MSRDFSYRKSVFVNCPFDDDYSELFDAILFAIYDCGFIARCALEVDDSAEVRSQELITMIVECRYGIHDICRDIKLDPDEHEFGTGDSLLDRTQLNSL